MSERVNKLVNSMTMEQKIGQMLVYGFSGHYPHPDILEVIDKYHVAGFRITPFTRKFFRYLKEGSPGLARVRRSPEEKERVYNTSIEASNLSAVEYAKVLNVLRERSLNTGAGIPLYFAVDFEGNQSADFLAPGLVSFPHPMGLSASGDSSLCRRTGEVIARQLKAVGIDWIHSPVLDVNTVPLNPEIGTRSYSPKPEIVAEYGLQSMLGFMDGGVISTGKHFPGRGHSGEDAHYDIIVIQESIERMEQVHMAPYKTLIKHGLPSIMLAHTIYPSLDPSKEVATVSRPIVTGFLREKLGFDGVIITDSFTMGGLVAKYEVPEAAIRAYEAGVDLILLKDENALRGEVYNGVLSAVRKGRLKEEKINQSVERILSVKEKYGLLGGNKGIVDIGKIEEALNNPKHLEVSKEAAYKSVVMLRCQKGLLPLKPKTKVLVVEEVTSLHRRFNNSICHLGAFYEALLERGVDAIFTDFENENFEKAWPVICERAEHVDLVIHTGFYDRNKVTHSKIYKNFVTLKKPTIFVSNSTYSQTVSPDMQNVLVTFSQFDVSMRAAADILTGRAETSARLDFDFEKTY